MEREALKLAVDGLEKILHTFAKDGKVVMASMIRNELFAEVNSLLQQAKASLAQPAQEPVAWEQFYPDIGKPKLAYLPPTKSPENACYTTPPKREWIGLTPEEINAVNAGFTSSSSFHAGALWAQAKLKEKNFD